MVKFGRFNTLWMKTNLSASINDTELVSDGKPGQFALYPTTNNWTFILLDTINGDTYHVQWNQDKDKRGIYRIRVSLFS